MKQRRHFHRCYSIDDECCDMENYDPICYKTNPLQVGNLFDSHWNKTSHPQPTLRTSLFEYYLANGWTNPSNHRHFIKNQSACVINENHDSDNNHSDPNTNNPLLKQVMLGAAARGDIEGMNYLFNHHRHHHQYHLFYHNFKNDTDLCTVAGAAGRLEALEWLLRVQKCKWKPGEVFREASENLHTHIMLFVEEYNEASNSDNECFRSKKSTNLDFSMPYGEGMPW